MNTLRLTLNQSLEEVIQELEQAYKPMSRTEILKMTIAEFYNSRFGNTGVQKTSAKGGQKRTKAQNIQIAKQIVEENKDLNIPKDEIDEIMADYWEVEIQPGLNEFLDKQEANT